MKTIVVIIAVAVLALFANSVQARHLPAPTGLVCPVVDDVIMANWDTLIDPDTGEPVLKYSLAVIGTYDTGVAGVTGDDSTVDFDFGTSDRSDGFLMSDSFLNIPLVELLATFDEIVLAPYDVMLRVKGLTVGGGNGQKGKKGKAGKGGNAHPQNHVFSEFCDVILP